MKATGILRIPDYQTVNEENKREDLLNSSLTKSGLIQITGFVMARLLGLLLLLLLLIVVLFAHFIFFCLASAKEITFVVCLDAREEVVATLTWDGLYTKAFYSDFPEMKIG